MRDQRMRQRCAPPRPMSPPASRCASAHAIAATIAAQPITITRAWPVPVSTATMHTTSGKNARSSENAPCPRLNAASDAAATLAQPAPEHQPARRYAVDEPCADHAQQRTARLRADQHGALRWRDRKRLHHDATLPSTHTPAHRPTGSATPCRVLAKPRRRPRRLTQTFATCGELQDDRVVPQARRSRVTGRAASRRGLYPIGPRPPVCAAVTAIGRLACSAALARWRVVAHPVGETRQQLPRQVVAHAGMKSACASRMRCARSRPAATGMSGSASP